MRQGWRRLASRWPTRLERGWRRCRGRWTRSRPRSARAFKDKLVPKDPNDEPASKKLDRIESHHEPSPGGTTGNSPAIHRWVHRANHVESRQGRKKSFVSSGILFRLSRAWSSLHSQTTVETVSYGQSSLTRLRNCIRPFGKNPCSSMSSVVEPEMRDIHVLRGFLFCVCASRRNRRLHSRPASRPCDG